MTRRKAIKSEHIKLEACPQAVSSDDMTEAVALAQECPTGSGDTIANTDVDMSQDGSAAQCSTADEGYHTSVAGKDPTPTPRSSSTIRSSLPTSQVSAGIRSTPKNKAQSRSESRSTDTGGGLDVLGRGVKRLVQGMNFLRQLGVENLVDPLPKIVVVGGQSTGKSSLIEAISEIKVPRNTGTTTRCPIEINLSETSNGSPHWSCKVILHKKYVYSGGQDVPHSVQSQSTSVEPFGRMQNQALGPWLEYEPEDTLFAVIDKKDELESALFWAQLATLNPGNNPELYKPGCNENTSPSFQVKFSPNVVRLDIAGPGLPNLSFFDLPGVINAADSKERYLVDLVAKLVKEYIRADNCINLLTLPMTDDVENSTAYGIIKEEEAEHRTIGVLTKPDRTQRGDKFDQWKTILDGKEHQLGHGYFVTKQCDQAAIDRGVNHAEARAQETDFFSYTEPWATELAHYNERFGTENLQTLPQIDEQVRKKASSIDLELATLPQPPAEDLQVEVNSKLLEFNYRLQQYLDGGSSFNHFQTNWMYLAEQFRDSILRSHPKLVVRDPSETPRKAPHAVESERKHTRTPGTPTPFRGQTIELIDSEDDTPCKPEFVPMPSRKRAQKTIGVSLESPIKKKTALDRVPEAKPFTTVKGMAARFTLSKIRQAIRDAHSSGNPLHVDPKAADRLSMASLGHWNTVLVELLDTTDQKLRDLVDRCLIDIFGIYKQTKLFTELSALCDSFLKDLMGEQRKVCQRVYDLEVFKVFALNEPALVNYRAAALADLSEARRVTRTNIYLDDQEAKLGKPTTGQEREVKILKVTDAQIGPDPFAKEVDVMSIVRGYYTYSGSRFVDNTCQSIQAELLVKCRNQIYSVLREGLGIVGPGAHDCCAQLLAEDPQLEVKRAQLKKERETLAKAQEWFARLAEDGSDIDFDQNLFVS
ncbi:MAG: hypothetical protein M1835_006215 [Candelina submexicana]|nr:MAG: hypothetical protein M1835_006215 [Candelina submexicana]